MSGLTRDGTAEPVPRDQILRCERGPGKKKIPVQLTTRRIGQPNRLMPNLLINVMAVHEHTYMSITYQAPTGSKLEVNYDTCDRLESCRRKTAGAPI